MHDSSDQFAFLGLILEVIGFVILIPMVLRLVKNEKWEDVNFSRLHFIFNDYVIQSLKQPNIDEAIPDLAIKCGFRVRPYDEHALVDDLLSDWAIEFEEKYEEFFKKWRGKIDPDTTSIPFADRSLTDDVYHLSNICVNYKIKSKRRFRLNIAQSIAISFVILGLAFQGLSVFIHS